jgi:hypothetical protein
MHFCLQISTTHDQYAYDSIGMYITRIVRFVLLCYNQDVNNNDDCRHVAAIVLKCSTMFSDDDCDDDDDVVDYDWNPKERFSFHGITAMMTMAVCDLDMFDHIDRQIVSMFVYLLKRVESD